MKKEKKLSLKGNPLIKLLLLLLLLASILVSVYGAGVAAAAYAFDTRYDGKANVLHRIYDDIGYADAVQVYTKAHRSDRYENLINKGCNFEYKIVEADGTVFSQSNPDVSFDENDYRTLHYSMTSFSPSVKTVAYEEETENGDVVDYYLEYSFADVYLFIDLSKGFTDRYAVAEVAVDQMYLFGYWALLFTFGGLALALFFIILLCSMAGRYGRDGEVRDNFLSKVWLEIPIALIAFYAYLACSVIYEMGERLITIPVIFAGAGSFVIFIALLIMNIAHRIKVGGFWKRTLIGIVLINLWKGLVFVGKSLWHLLMSMRLMGRTALAAVIFIIAATLVLIMTCDYYNTEALCVCCVLAVIFIVCFMFITSYMLKKLQKGIDNLASGNFNEKTDTKHLFPTFKTAAEKINVASDGMNKAVEERIKSERMRTELITNVSHDIKTPLTSIINYSDLICSEQVENEKVTEYAEILHRQGERLKRLLEDLLEASKASTGNLEVVLEPCALNVLVSQIAAEYEEKFAGAGLKLVTELPEQESTILADGRRLFRVLDNLLNNACKYSLAGTRVYMSVDVNDEYGRIIIKNTSKCELNVSPDELMERFVRGDASRTTEGSGLGLSIAQSLTELQGGKLTLAIDGDLFKAIVCMKRDTIHS